MELAFFVSFDGIFCRWLLSDCVTLPPHVHKGRNSGKNGHRVLGTFCIQWRRISSGRRSDWLNETQSITNRQIINNCHSVVITWCTRLQRCAAIVNGQADDQLRLWPSPYGNVADADHGNKRVFRKNPLQNPLKTF
jgi:hypothetical protein